MTWSVSSGSLPSGISLDGTAGTLSGYPAASGTSSFTLTATDSSTPTAQTATAPMSVVVQNPPLQFVPSPVGEFIQGVPTYPEQLAATGGLAPYTWSATHLPPGLIFSATGLLSGTPTVSGSAAPVITVTDSQNQSASFTYHFYIEGEQPLAVYPVAPQTVVKGQPLVLQIGVYGGTPPYTFTLESGLPTDSPSIIRPE